MEMGSEPITRKTEKIYFCLELNMTISRRLRLGVVTVFFLAATWLPAYAATVTRGPYLQMGTPSSIVIKWRTDIPSNSRVSCGMARRG